MHGPRNAVIAMTYWRNACGSPATTPTQFVVPNVKSVAPRFTRVYQPSLDAGFVRYVSMFGLKLNTMGKSLPSPARCRARACSVAASLYSEPWNADQSRYGRRSRGSARGRTVRGASDAGTRRDSRKRRYRASVEREYPNWSGPALLLSP